MDFSLFHATGSLTNHIYLRNFRNSVFTPITYFSSELNNWQHILTFTFFCTVQCNIIMQHDPHEVHTFQINTHDSIFQCLTSSTFWTVLRMNPWGSKHAEDVRQKLKNWINLKSMHFVSSSCRRLKRLLDTLDRNGSTSGPTPWQIYDDDDEVA
jgi:hypothetical protein